MSFLKRFFGAKKKAGDGQQTGPETTVLVMPSGEAHTVPVPVQQIVTIDRSGAIVPLGQSQTQLLLTPSPLGQAQPLAQGLPPGVEVMPRVKDSKVKSIARRVLRG